MNNVFVRITSVRNPIETCLDGKGKDTGVSLMTEVQLGLGNQEARALNATRPLCHHLGLSLHISSIPSKKRKAFPTWPKT